MAVSIFYINGWVKCWQTFFKLKMNHFLWTPSFKQMPLTDKITVAQLFYLGAAFFTIYLNFCKPAVIFKRQRKIDKDTKVYIGV